MANKEPVDGRAALRDVEPGAAASAPEAAAGGFGSMLPAPLATGGVRPLRRLASGDDPLGGEAAPPALLEVLRRRAGGGTPLPRTLAASFSDSLGHDLGGVRVHADPEANGVAEAIQSAAFTHGDDVYFGRGMYRPDTDSGQRLVAHELGHIVARRSGEDRGQSGPLAIGRADDPAEAAADRIADRTMHAIRRSTAPAGPTARNGAVTEPGRARSIGPTAHELRRWPWSKKKDAPAEEAATSVSVPTKDDFVKATAGGAPADAAEARTRMQNLRSMLRTMTSGERNAIATDKNVMKSARTFVGDGEYRSLLAAVDTYHLPTRKGVKAARKEGRGNGVHMDGREADAFIRRNMGAIAHLKGYIDSAVESGKQAEGFVAVVSDKQWRDIYETTFPDEPVGSDDELTTNAYVATSNADRPAIIHQDRGTRSTAIHESMHRYSESGVNITYGFNMNEGITEYFTRLITDMDGNPTNGKPSNRDNYQQNWEFVCAMLPMLGDDLVTQQTQLAEIYFPGKPDLLKTHFETACKAAGLSPRAIASRWDRLIAHVRGGKWRAARAKLPPPPAPAPVRAPSPAPSDTTDVPATVGG